MSYSWPGLGGASRIVILTAAGVGLFALGVLVGSRSTRSTETPTGAATAVAPTTRFESRVVRTPEVSPPETATPEATPPVYEEFEIPGSVGARIALVIDDLGRSVEDLAHLGDLGVPMTYSVLPFEARTPDVVAEIRRRGWELI